MAKISSYPNGNPPTDSDEFIVARAGANYKLSWLNLKTALSTFLDWATGVHAATSKATPVDSDELGLVDSAASFSLKKLTWANLKATLKTYFDTLYTAFGGREVLTANRTYYVRTDGSDSNTGLTNTAGGAFLTTQKALDTVAMLDRSIYDVTIQHSNGTYSVATGNLLKNGVGSGMIIILGDETTPSNVVIKITSTNSTGGCFYGSGINTTYSLRGLQFQTDAASNTAVYLSNRSYLEFQNCDFSAGSNNFLRHLLVLSSAVIQPTGNYTISAGCANHLFTSTGKIQTDTVITVTITGTPAWTNAFIANTNGGFVAYYTITFSGSATGPKVRQLAGSVLFLGGQGLDYLPGSSYGSNDETSTIDGLSGAPQSIAPSQDVLTATNTSIVLVNSLTIASGKKYIISSGSIVKILNY